MRVRFLITAMFHVDAVLWNVDQKPFHLNEAGSKKEATMDFQGEANVELHELHAHTRARWSANTTCVSDKVDASKIPPLECLFKGRFTAFTWL